MLNGLKHAHSGLRWVVLALLIWAIANAFSGWKKNREYTDKDLKVHKFAFISLHVQLLLGLGLYALNWGVKVDFSQMKVPVIRFYSVEHIFLMLLAIIIVSVGYIRSKKMTETPARFRTVCIAYGIGLLLILAAIPWPFGHWASYGGGWG
jgi:hypothetical protein